MKKSKLKLLIFIFLTIGIIILDRHFQISKMLREPKEIEKIRYIALNNKLYSILVYLFSTVLGCVLLALPGAFFAIIADGVFGPYLGSLLCLIASTLGALLSFLVGRFFLKDSIKPILEKNKLLKKILYNENDESIVTILMITRIIPIFPYNLQNFAYGITDIKIIPYTVFSFIFMIPGVLIFTLGTEGFLKFKEQNTFLVVAAFILFLTILAIIFIKKKYIDKRKKTV